MSKPEELARTDALTLYRLGDNEAAVALRVTIMGPLWVIHVNGQYPDDRTMNSRYGQQTFEWRTRAETIAQNILVELAELEAKQAAVKSSAEALAAVKKILQAELKTKIPGGFQNSWDKGRYHMARTIAEAIGYTYKEAVTEPEEGAS